jgi:hypothetical protein
MWSMLLALATATASQPLPYDGPLVDAFTRKACPIPVKGYVRDGTIEYSVDAMLNATPAIMERCHAMRLDLWRAENNRRKGNRR